MILRGWGVMNPTALKEAARVRFPATKILGVWWSGAEEDVIPAGKAAIGYVAAGFHPSGRDFPMIQEILDIVHGAGKGNISSARVGTIYHNRGIIAGILTTVEYDRRVGLEWEWQAMDGAMTKAPLGGKGNRP